MRWTITYYPCIEWVGRVMSRPHQPKIFIIVAWQPSCSRKLSSYNFLRVPLRLLRHLADVLASSDHTTTAGKKKRTFLKIYFFKAAASKSYMCTQMPHKIILSSQDGSRYSDKPYGFWAGQELKMEDTIVKGFIVCEMSTSQEQKCRKGRTELSLN